MFVPLTFVYYTETFAKLCRRYNIAVEVTDCTHFIMQTNVTEFATWSPFAVRPSTSELDIFASGYYSDVSIYRALLWPLISSYIGDTTHSGLHSNKLDCTADICVVGRLSQVYGLCLPNQRIILYLQTLESFIFQTYSTRVIVGDPKPVKLASPNDFSSSRKANRFDWTDWGKNLAGLVPTAYKLTLLVFPSSQAKALTFTTPSPTFA